MPGATSRRDVRSQDGVQGGRAAARAVGRLCVPAQDQTHRAHPRRAGGARQAAVCAAGAGAYLEGKQARVVGGGGGRGRWVGGGGGGGWGALALQAADCDLGWVTYSETGQPARYGSRPTLGGATTRTLTLLQFWSTVPAPPPDPCLQAYSACEQGADHAAVLGRMVQGLGLAGVPPRALQHPDARSALRSVLR